MPRRTPATLASLFAIVLAVAPVAAQDYAMTFMGTTVGGHPWNRPATLTTLSAQCTACSFATDKFSLSADSQCVIVSQQSHNGHLALYRGLFLHDLPLTNLVEVNDDGDLGAGTSRIPGNPAVRSLLLPAGSYTLVTSANANGQEGTYLHTLHCDEVQPIQGSCGITGPDLPPAAKRACFYSRFLVFVDRVTHHPGDGVATPVYFATKETAFFWFYGELNFEVVVKILDGCAINDHYWVYAAALTNQGYRIRVLDNMTGEERAYSNTEGTLAPAVNHVTAFDCEP